MKHSRAIFTAIMALGMTFNAQAASNTPKTKATASRQALYDFTFVATDFRTAFQAIGQRAGVDILPDQGIAGKLTLKVHQKTWQETLDIICGLNNFKYLIDNRFVHVLPKAEFQKRIQEDAKNAQAYDEIAPRAERIFYLKNAKANDILPIAQSMISSQGRINVIERNNALVAYDTDLRLNKIDSIINALDVETKQIVIAAKLLVIDADYLREIGVNWNASGGSGNAPDLKGTPGTGQISDSRTVTGMTNTPNLSPAATGTNIAMGLLQGKIGVTLNSLLQESKGELLANPQITTLDHKEATIFMGEKRSIRVTDAVGISSNQLIDAGIELKVVPHVTGDNRVMLELEPQNNSFTSDAAGALIINTQKAKTAVVVDDGETVVIAGLTRNQEENVEVGVPVLKDIPLLGNLFKYNKKSVKKKDLIVFVTPQISDPAKRLQMENAQVK